jgi:2-polyprenyl-3-methyl-5-hydroxy-6-metoxy-1,4-benzoquinol methylase
MEKEEYFNSYRKEMVNFLPRTIRKSIEFGCGFGNFSGFIKEKYQAETWGVDINPVAIEKSEKILDRVIKSEALSSLELLPENYFDCVICNDFLEHLEYPDIFLRELKRCVTKNAVLVASVPNVRHYPNIKKLLLYKDWNYSDAGVLDKTHLRFFTQKSLKRFIQENDMTIESFKGINKLKSFRLTFLNFILAGFISDMFYLQFAFRAKFN